MSYDAVTDAGVDITVTLYRYQEDGGDQPYYEVGTREDIWAMTTLEDTAQHKLNSDFEFKEAVKNVAAVSGFALMSALMF